MGQQTLEQHRKLEHHRGSIRAFVATRGPSHAPATIPDYDDLNISYLAGDAQASWDRGVEGRCLQRPMSWVPMASQATPRQTNKGGNPYA